VLPAIKNDRIHLVNSDVFDRASPRLVEGLELLASLIHPQCQPHRQAVQQP
jgi:iron complex transport system substrate-binding protein